MLRFHNDSVYFILSYHELKSNAVNVLDVDARVVLEVFAEFGDIDVHRSGVEVVFLFPDLLQGLGALQGVAHVLAEHQQQVGFLRGQFLGLLTIDEQMTRCVESVGAQMEQRRLVSLF